MREFQPAGVLVASVSGNYTLAGTASTDLLHTVNESDLRSPISVDSHFSLLTAASSTLSIVSQANQCDWPEFRESYNSIMDNTNLLDSCAAALNDISCEEGMSPIRPDKLRKFNRSLSSTTSNSSLSGSNNSVTTKNIEKFTRWLCYMENRMAAQPKLSKIVAMKPKQLSKQLEIHSGIFNEILVQPCIVKGTTQSQYKTLEERYHLLYLEVYEVLLLFDVLPTNNFSSSNHILSESFHEFNYESNSKEQSSDQIDSSDNKFLNDEIYDKSDSELKTPIYTETSILSTSIGTYYFNYDDSIIEEQQTDNITNRKLSSTAIEISDKEFTFENDLHSLLNVSDSLCLKSHEQTLDSEHRPLQHPQIDKTIDVSIEKNHIWNKIDFSELAVPSTTNIAEQSHLTKDIKLVHHKVYDWLHSKTDSYKSKSTVSLATSEADYQLLYRAKSEMDLSTFRPFDLNHRTSSLRTSLNCLPSALSPVERFDVTFNDSIPEESSLIWDNYQLGDEFVKVDFDIGLASSDYETKELINKLCYFGDDYSTHLNSSIESEQDLNSEIEKCVEKNSVSNVCETSGSTQSASIKVRRSRRIRNKQLKRHSNISTDTDCSSSESSQQSLDQSSDANQSEATTASINSNMVSSTLVEDTQNATTNEEFIPEKTISYNCSEKHFVLHTKESNEPKKMKINEMQPEDFYDIVKMCQNNIDCVITVLGADSNRILTVAYCQQMKFERYQESTCKCKQETNNDAATQTMCNQQRTKDIKCNSINDIVESNSNDMCICAWISHTIAMILNFLIDFWNVFRNMKLYTYLCRVTKALFGSTRYVADHLKSKRELLNAKAIKYS